MTNADRFKAIFGLYATELWAMPEKEFLKWLNADATDTNVATTDAISRAAVVNAIEGVDWYHINRNGEMVHGANDAEHQAWYKADDIYAAIERVPSAQPERKTGKWIERNPQNSPDCRLIECSECGNAYIVGYNINYDDWIDGRNFCMKCGADLREGNNGKNT